MTMRAVIDVDDPMFGISTPSLLGEPVDLIRLIRDGIPEPEYVPGCDGWLRAGKRYLMPAPAGTGKSLLMLVVAIGVADNGGTVVIIDVENGADEYARRLECILAANDHDGSLAELCQQRITYYEWPKLSLEWDPETWVASLNGADLVIFDSSRFALSSVGLAEDKSDDYAEFATALIMPLSQAGITTVILDNTGHVDQARARGTKAKDDLNEVVYALSAVGKPDIDTTAILKMTLTRQRFGGLHRHLQARIGGGIYEQPAAVEQSYTPEGKIRRTWYMEQVSRAVEASPGASYNGIQDVVKRNKDYVRGATNTLIAEGYIRVQPGPGNSQYHHSVRSYRDEQRDDQ